MAHPKRKHSNHRSRIRRSHDHLEVRSLSECSHCKKRIMPHRICHYCGHYKGKQVLTIKVKSKDKAGSQ